MELETIRAIEASFNIMDIMKRAKEEDVPDGVVYEDHLVRVEKVNGTVLLSGQPIKFPFIYQG